MSVDLNDVVKAESRVNIVSDGEGSSSVSACVKFQLRPEAAMEYRRSLRFDYEFDPSESAVHYHVS